MKRLTFAFTALLLLTNTLIYAANGTLPGTGTASDPYLIEDFVDFQTFCDQSNATKYWSTDVYSQLTTDLDLDPNLPGRQTYTQAPIAPDTNNDQYGYSGIKYNGNFNGNDHTINNLTIDGNDYCALFGFTDDQSSISNLTLNNSKISGNSLVAGLVANNNGIINSCYCDNAIIISGSDYTPQYEYDYLHEVGGLAAYNSGEIFQCYSSGSVLCVLDRINNAGGLVASNSGTISQCYSTCTVNCTGYVGGLIGYNYQGIVENCYSTGDVHSIGPSGGLIGTSEEGYITNCYSTGFVTGMSWYSTGFIGLPNYYNTIENCYHYQFSSPSTINISTPLNDEELKVSWYFDGFDFAGYTYDGTDDIWDIEIDYDHEIYYMPRLSWQDTPGFQPPHYWENLSTTLSGSGTEQAPFIIADYNDLIEFRNNQKLTFGHYSLTADIDLAAYEYETALIPRVFGGQFDGCNHKISNLKLTYNEDNPASKVLSFYIGSFGTITNLNLDNVNISAERYDTGGLTCWNEGNIINCHVSGSITAESYGGAVAAYNFANITQCSSSCDITGGSITGGLVGSNQDDSATISESYSTGSVNASGYAGGLAGENFHGHIINCYSTASVNGRNSGGFIGHMQGGEIANCYSAGSVIGEHFTSGFIGYYYSGDISYCFWDIETSQTDTAYFEPYEYHQETKYRAVNSLSDRIEGKTTAELQTNKFAFWNWDFVYGLPYSKAIWYISPNQYPSIMKVDIPVEIIDWWILPREDGANDKLYVKVRNNTEHDIINCRIGFLDTEDEIWLDLFISYDHYFPIGNVKAGETVLSNGCEIYRYYQNTYDLNELEWIPEFDFTIQKVDINQDKQINLEDFAVLSSFWQETICDFDYAIQCRPDLDRSYNCDLKDLLILSEHWLESY